MIENTIFATMGIFALITIRKWWHGVFLCLVTGFAQDPLRKLLTGEPVYMVVLVAGLFGIVVLGLISSGYRFKASAVPGWNNGVSQAMVVYMMMVGFQMFHSYINYQNLFIVSLGFLTYIAPVLAIFTGYYFACHVRESGIKKFMWCYVGFCTLSTVGIYLEYFGVDSRMLGEVGSGLQIFDVGTILVAYSGLFRSSEIAAWHIYLGSAFLIILGVNTKSTLARIILVTIVAMLIGAGILTGRRKLIVTLLIFISCYWFFSLYYLQKATKVAFIIVFLLGASLWVAGKNELFQEENEQYELYVERASGVFGDISGRVQTLGTGFLMGAIKRYGVLGIGAGATSSGARFSSRGPRAHGLSEGGLAKIVIELGVFGLVTILWLVFMLARNFWEILRYLSNIKDEYVSFYYGLVAVLLANSAHFFIASQVFNDPFILLLLGFIVGFISSSPRLARDKRLRESAITRSGQLSVNPA